MKTRIPVDKVQAASDDLQRRLEMSTAEIGLAVRTTNCLEEKGVFTVNDLLHCSPEAYVGGPLALVKTGDRITVDVPARRIHLEASDDELARRKAAWKQPPSRFERGYGWMFSRHILQANEGCDFDFLETEFGAPVSEPVIY